VRRFGAFVSNGRKKTNATKTTEKSPSRELFTQKKIQGKNPKSFLSLGLGFVYHIFERFLARGVRKRHKTKLGKRTCRKFEKKIFTKKKSKVVFVSSSSEFQRPCVRPVREKGAH
jgi:hypothetical protein